MRMISKKGKVHKGELPGAVARSGKKARRAFAEAHDAAAEKYGEGQRALRIAFSTLEQTHEKVGKRWERKDGGGKSHAEHGTSPARGADTTRVGNAGPQATKAQLYDTAKRLDIQRRSTMTKSELATAIAREERRRARAARA